MQGKVAWGGKINGGVINSLSHRVFSNKEKT